MEKKRITELDAFRGLCILGVVLSHFYFVLVGVLGLDLPLTGFLQVLFQYGGILFVLLSGVCVTLGSHSVRRGLTVLGCGLAVSAVTVAFGLLTDNSGTFVWFGVLHLLGISMLLYPLLRRLPNGVMAALGVLIIALGYWFDTFTVSVPWLFPLGLVPKGFYSADYWPLFPQLGFFMLGVVLGRTVYREKKPLIPKLQGKCRFLAFCGRHSLVLYLAQQPVTMALFALLALLRR